MDARVTRFEVDMTEIKITLARIDERLSGMANNLATKADLEALRGEMKEVKGSLSGKLGFWQFITVSGGAVALILAWPRVAAFLGI